MRKTLYTAEVSLLYEKADSAATKVHGDVKPPSACSYLFGTQFCEDCTITTGMERIDTPKELCM